MNRLKPYQFKALQNIFLGLKGEVYLFGSKVDNQRKGGDIDIVWLTNDKECQNLNTKLKLTRDYQKINDERIDILILPPEDQMSNQEKVFYSCIDKQKLFL
jgi:predicted nucleotidyltransferase